MRKGAPLSEQTAACSSHRTSSPSQHRRPHCPSPLAALVGPAALPPWPLHASAAPPEAPSRREQPPAWRADGQASAVRLPRRLTVPAAVAVRPAWPPPRAPRPRALPPGLQPAHPLCARPPVPLAASRGPLPFPESAPTLQSTPPPARQQLLLYSLCSAGGRTQCIHALEALPRGSGRSFLLAPFLSPARGRP